MILKATCYSYENCWSTSYSASSHWCHSHPCVLSLGTILTSTRLSAVFKSRWCNSDQWSQRI